MGGPDESWPTRVKRLAIGSCNKQDRNQAHWSVVSALEPQVWVWAGDAVYAKGTSVGALKKAVARLRSDGNYSRFASSVNVLGVWDDHDLGVNDGGSKTPDLDLRREAYLDLLFDDDKEHEHERRVERSRRRRALYSSAAFDDKLRVILMDTRSFREDHLVPSVGATARGVPVLGRLTPLLAAATRLLSQWLARYVEYSADVLGEEQWEWLEAQLACPEQFVVLVSSIQLGTSNPSFESWGHFPVAKQRLLSLLEKRQVLVVSGDVHHAEITANPPKDNAVYEGLFELTTSGLTHTLATSAVTRMLFPPLLHFFHRHRPNPAEFTTKPNFATIDFDYENGFADIAVRAADNDDDILLKARLAFSQRACSSSSQQAAA